MFQNQFLPNCYESVEEWDKTLMYIRFCLDSVLLPGIGIHGMLANIIVIVTLIRITRKKSSHGNHKNFDRLIILLSLIDFWLIFFYVVDALIQIDIMTEPQFYQVNRHIHCRLYKCKAEKSLIGINKSISVFKQVFC